MYTKVYYSNLTGFTSILIDSNYMVQGTIVDFDLDGIKDIITSRYAWWENHIILRIFKNLGNESFQQLPDIILPGNYGSMNVYDFNNDGYPDILFTHTDGYHIMYNQGNFQLGNTLFIAIPAFGSIRSTYCADLDNNSFNDIVSVFSDFSYSHLYILFNDGQGHFIPDPIVGTRQQSNFKSFNLTNYPNPFENETIFQFYLNETGLVDLTVYDLQGKFITYLINQKLQEGPHSIKWRGLDNSGHPCKPGTYIAYLKVNGKICRAIKIIKT